MKYLPIGLDIQGRTCVVVGGGAVGTRKVENLLRADADVRLVSPEASASLEELAASGKITWIPERFQARHLDGVLLAVAATDDEGVNEAVVEAAKARATLVCDASSADRSEFIFGALHHRGGVTIAVFTDGTDPSRSRTTRDRIAALVSEAEGPDTPANG